MKSDIQLYPDLIKALEKNEIVYLFGAGFSTALSGRKYTWWDWIVDGIGRIKDHATADMLNESLMSDNSTDNMVSVVGKVIKILKEEGSYKTWMHEAFESTVVVNEKLKNTLMKILLMQDVFATTNYDHLLENATGLMAVSYEEPNVAFQMLKQGKSNNVLHIHGIYDSEKEIDNIVADAFNYLIYGGEAVVDPKQLQELDTTEIALPFGSQDEEGKQPEEAVQKYRDVLKSAIIKQDDEAAYILLGIENQTDIHYAMPVRNIIYDALQYGKQVADIAAKHRASEGDSKGHSRGEYLSGFYKEDKITPVITLVLHFGANEWDGPLSLHEMMAVKNKNLLNFVQDYQIHLIDPAKLSAEDLKRFSSSLREVIGYIKYSKDKKRLSEFLTDNPRMLIEANAARVIKAVTNTPLDIPEGAEVIDVCKAVEEMMNESEERGELRMLVKQVRKGRITIEQAAEDANMSVEQFKRVMDDTPLQAV